MEDFLSGTPGEQPQGDIKHWLKQALEAQEKAEQAAKEARQLRIAAADMLEAAAEKDAQQIAEERRVFLCYSQIRELLGQGPREVPPPEAPPPVDESTDQMLQPAEPYTPVTPKKGKRTKVSGQDATPPADLDRLRWLYLDNITRLGADKADAPHLKVAIRQDPRAKPGDLDAYRRVMLDLQRIGFVRSPGDTGGLGWTTTDNGDAFLHGHRLGVTLDVDVQGRRDALYSILKDGHTLGGAMTAEEVHEAFKVRVPGTNLSRDHLRKDLRALKEAGRIMRVAKGVWTIVV